MRRRAYAAFIDNQTHPDQTHQNDKSLATTGWCMHVKVEDGEARARTERVPIVLAGADCNGTEGALADCLGKPLGRVGRQCIHDTDVYLVCYAPDRGAHILNCMPGQASNVFYSFFFFDILIVVRCRRLCCAGICRQLLPRGCRQPWSKAPGCTDHSKTMHTSGMIPLIVIGVMTRQPGLQFNHLLQTVLRMCGFRIPTSR